MSTGTGSSSFLPTSVSLLGRLKDVGDHVSWQRFHDTYVRLLFSVAKRAGLSESEAQDVVQETLIDVAGQMPGFRYDRSKGSFKNWLLLVLRRRIADFFRKLTYQHGDERVLRSERLDSDVAARQPIPDPDLDRVWAEEWHRHTLDAALARVKKEVKPLQFQICDLHVLKELSVDAVRERLGVGMAEVYWAKYRISARLKRALREVEEAG